MAAIDILEEIYDRIYYKLRFSKIGQYAMLAYNTTFDDVLLIPRKSLTSRKSACIKTKLTKNIQLSIPLVSSNMDTVTGVEMAAAMANMGGIGFIYRLTNSIEEEAEMIKEVKKRGLNLNMNYLVGASVGVKGAFMERAKMLIDAGTDIIIFDVANGYSNQMAYAIKTFKSKHPNVPIVAGNVATPGGVKFLAKLGVDCIKVGIGPGSVCTTRIVTGHGVPQLSAIYRCAKKAKKYGIPIIADGGIRNSGDIVKALAVGADVVMLGSLFAGTFESPGDVYTIEKNKIQKVPITKVTSIEPEDYDCLFKIYRGMSGKDVQIDAQKKTLSQKNEIVAEGVSKKIPYKGPVKPIIEQLIGGLMSGMSYSHSKTIKELQKKAIFEKVSTLGQKENTPHAKEFKHYR
ncbi:IMP dehydrogenase [Candidatus Woesearchaeota archaeon]|nr:IMP dehydrogenase [Candidatus Woesearchaeota archaeon]